LQQLILEEIPDQCIAQQLEMAIPFDKEPLCINCKLQKKE
jgi:hypothetical protein